MNNIIQITYQQLFLGSSITIVGIGIIQWFLSILIKAKLEQSIRYGYDKKLEEEKFLISKRDKIANIASFFSLWIKYRGNEKKWLEDKELIEYYQELTKMSFELALWIDDEELLKDVMKRLKNEDGSESTVELLIKVKRLISYNKNTTLKADDITIWPKDFQFIEEGKK